MHRTALPVTAACSRRRPLVERSPDLPLVTERIPSGRVGRLRRGAGPVGPVPQEGLGRGHVQGTGEEEPLPAVAVLVLQEREILLLFDALGDRVDREGLAQLYERVDQRL